MCPAREARLVCDPPRCRETSGSGPGQQDRCRRDHRHLVVARGRPQLDRVRAAASLPVCTGFGIRDAAQVRRLTGHAGGVIVGSALVDLIDADGDAAAFLGGLRA